MLSVFTGILGSVWSAGAALRRGGPVYYLWGFWERAALCHIWHRTQTVLPSTWHPIGCNSLQGTDMRAVRDRELRKRGEGGGGGQRRGGDATAVPGHAERVSRDPC